MWRVYSGKTDESKTIPSNKLYNLVYIMGLETSYGKLTHPL